MAESIMQANRLSEGFKKASASAGTMNVPDLRAAINDQMMVLSQLELKFKEVSGAVANMPMSSGRSILEVNLQNQQQTIDESKAAIDGLNAKYGELSSGKASQLDGMIAGVQGLSDAWSVASAIIGIFTDDQQKLADVQTKLQTVMAVLTSVQQVANTLQSTSVFSTKTLAAVTDLYTGAVSRTAAVMKICGLSTKAATVAAHGLYAALTLGLSVAIGVAVAAYSKWSEKQEENKRKQEELAQASRDFAKSVGDQAAAPIAAYKSLQTEWESLGDSFADKQKFIDDNAAAFDKLGVHIGSVAEAEDLFKKHEAAFIASMNNRAKAAAAMGAATQSYATAIAADVEIGMLRARREPLYEKRQTLQRQGKNGEAADVTDEINEFTDQITAQMDIRDNAQAIANGMITIFVDASKAAADGLKNAGNATPEEADAQKAEADRKAKAAETARKKQEQANTAANNAELAATAALYDAQTQLKRKQITDKIKLIEFDRKQTLARLKQQAEAEEDAAKTAASPKEKTAHEGAATAIRQRMQVVDDSAQFDIDAVNAENLNTLLQQYQTYTEKRAEIERKFNDEITQFQAQNKDGKYDENIKLAETQKQQTLSGLDVNQFKEGANWEDVFGNLENASAKALVQLQTRLKQYMDTSAKALAPDDLKALSTAYEELNAKIASLNPDTGFKTAVADYRKASKELKQARKEQKNAEGKGPEAEAAAQDKVTEALKKRSAAQEAANEKIQGFAGTAGEAFEAASAMTSMFEDFGLEIPDSIKGAMEGVGQMIEGLGSIDIANPFSIITGAFKMLGGLGKAITSLFGGDNRKEKDIQKLQERVDKLKKSYDALEESIAEAYSTDAADLLDGQNENLEKQNEAIQQQIAKEKSKKNADNARVKEMQAQIEANNKLIEENKKKAADAIFGEDLKSAIDNFASAYADAWTNGGDRAQSARDMVRKMMQNMVTESIKAALQSSKAMENIRKKLLQFYEDGVLDQTEQDMIYQMAEEVQRELDSRVGWADTLMTEDTKREGASRGIATASQESVDENNGRLTAIQGHTYTINENVKTLIYHSTRVLEHLSGIRAHTSNLIRLGVIEHDISSMKNGIEMMKNNLNDMAVKGISIRR